ncbi:MAG: glycosyltransferase family A protein [Elainellaceae cyanobacterium]
MVKSPLVSILICHLGHESFLKDAIESSLNQAYSPIEIVCINRHLNEQSQRVLADYGDRISVVSQNSSSTSFVDIGLRESHGEIVCFLGSNDKFLPDKISKIVDVFKMHPASQWCFHSLKLINHDSKTLLELFHRQESQEFNATSVIEKRGRLPFVPPSFSGLCFRRSLLEQMTPLPQTYSLSVAEYALKLTAPALSQGFCLSENLAGRRVDPTLAYSPQIERFRLDAAALPTTAHWIRHRFPTLKKLANNLFARGMGAYWQMQSGETKQHDLIQTYLSAVPITERLEINSKAAYRYLLPS